MKTATPRVPEPLLTGQAVNIRFASIKEKFTAIGVLRPIPFIVWQNKLTASEEARLQQAFCARATKADAKLIEPATRTLEQMERKHLNAA